MSWMDVLRGAAILLVILGHSSDLVLLVGREAPQLLHDVNTAAAPYRIPLLMFLSGMLVPNSLAKGVRPYLTGKVRGILWPYVVWTLLILLATGAFTAEAALGMLWLPPTLLWYLQVLFVGYVVALLTRVLNPLWPAAVALVGSALVPFDEYRLGRMLFLIAAFLCGTWAWQHRERWLGIVRRWWVMALLAVPTAVGAWFAITVGDTQYNPLAFPLVVCGLALALGLAQRVPDARIIRYIGRNSIVFYVTHWIVVFWSIRLLDAAVPGLPALVLVAAALASAVLVGLGVTWLSLRVWPVALLFRI
jgi:fucose 4-O-acetylase-like acetyltransferase